MAQQNLKSNLKQKTIKINTKMKNLIRFRFIMIKIKIPITKKINHISIQLLLNHFFSFLYDKFIYIFFIFTIFFVLFLKFFQSNNYPLIFFEVMGKLLFLFVIGNVINILAGLAIVIVSTISLLRTLYFNLIIFMVDMVGVVIIAVGIFGFVAHRYEFLFKMSFCF
jgi:hypothetical protein